MSKAEFWNQLAEESIKSWTAKGGLIDYIAEQLDEGDHLPLTEKVTLGDLLKADRERPPVPDPRTGMPTPAGEMILRLELRRQMRPDGTIPGDLMRLVTQYIERKQEL